MFEKQIKTLVLLLNELKKNNLSYPNENFIEIPGDFVSINEFFNFFQEIDTNLELFSFYKECRRLMLPEVGNGYFIHSIDFIDEIIFISEPFCFSAIIFGADGGGGFFAQKILSDSSEIYYLSDGVVNDSVFESDMAVVKKISNSFSEFLELLILDFIAFLNNDKDWKYII
jgi:hypothetical protein